MKRILLSYMTNCHGLNLTYFERGKWIQFEDLLLCYLHYILALVCLILLLRLVSQPSHHYVTLAHLVCKNQILLIHLIARKPRWPSFIYTASVNKYKGVTKSQVTQLRTESLSKLWETYQKRKFKALKNTFKTSKNIVIFSLIYNWPDWFKIKQNTAISKHFTKPTVYTRTSSGTIFSADVWINDSQVFFQYKPGAYL